MAFADDCTGVLEDLAMVPRFVDAVSRYASTAGLRLNVSKAVILPFQLVIQLLVGTCVIWGSRWSATWSPLSCLSFLKSLSPSVPDIRSSHSAHGLALPPVAVPRMFSPWEGCYSSHPCPTLA
uniref:Reverse transcriptase domain-containing protein n=1 Tax=Peronospora matthiolae TaxID=2874970 RepID=A0AAV1T710_9STRA